jgi:hypothetical protein
MTETPDDLVYRLRKRAEIRRSIPRTDSHGKDRISDLCEEAANEITRLRAAERDAALWNGLALLHPMDIATVICGAPDEKAMMAGLAKRIHAALAGSAQEKFCKHGNWPAECLTCIEDHAQEGR